MTQKMNHHTLQSPKYTKIVSLNLILNVFNELVQQVISNGLVSQTNVLKQD